jgi:hypothetical protein
MIGRLIEIAFGILMLIGFMRICAFVRQHCSQEEVMYLLGDALSPKIGHRISQHED